MHLQLMLTDYDYVVVHEIFEYMYVPILNRYSFLSFCCTVAHFHYVKDIVLVDLSFTFKVECQLGITSGNVAVSKRPLWRLETSLSKFPTIVRHIQRQATACVSEWPISRQPVGRFPTRMRRIKSGWKFNYITAGSISQGLLLEIIPLLLIAACPSRMIRRPLHMNS